MTEKYVNLLQHLKIFAEELRIKLGMEGVIGREPYLSIVEELDEIISNLSDPTVTKPIDNVEIVPFKGMLEIDRLGLGEIVSMYVTDNLSSARISDLLNAQGFIITKLDVDNWLSSVNSKGILDRPTLTGFGSVFDTQAQLQSVFDRLKELEIELDSQDESLYKGKVTKKQVQREFMSEVRATIKDATSLAKSLQRSDDIEDIKRIMIEEINKVSPPVAMSIWRRLRERGTSLN